MGQRIGAQSDSAFSWMRRSARPTKACPAAILTARRPSMLRSGWQLCRPHLSIDTDVLEDRCWWSGGAGGAQARSQRSSWCSERSHSASAVLAVRITAVPRRWTRPIRRWAALGEPRLVGRMSAPTLITLFKRVGCYLFHQVEHSGSEEAPIYGLPSSA